jgi:hypothetical protein
MAETPSCERQAMGRNGKQYVLKNHLYSVLSKNFLKDFFAE